QPPRAAETRLQIGDQPLVQSIRAQQRPVHVHAQRTGTGLQRRRLHLRLHKLSMIFRAIALNSASRDPVSLLFSSQVHYLARSQLKTIRLCAATGALQRELELRGSFAVALRTGTSAIN